MSVGNFLVRLQSMETSPEPSSISARVNRFWAVLIDDFRFFLSLPEVTVPSRLRLRNKWDAKEYEKTWKKTFKSSLCADDQRKNLIAVFSWSICVSGMLNQPQLAWLFNRRQRENGSLDRCVLSLSLDAERLEARLQLRGTGLAK